MKTLQLESVSIETVDNSEKVKEVILKQWNEFYSKEALAEDVELGFIFGKYAENEHYQREWIMGLINEVELELNPVVVEEPVIEEVKEEVVSPVKEEPVEEPLKEL